MSDTYRHIDVEQESDVLVLSIREKEMSEYEACAAIGHELVEAIGEADGQRVVVDLGNVEFLSSVGVVPFLSANRCMRERQGRLVLCGLSEFVHQVFSITRLLINPDSRNSPFEWTESREQAIEVLRS